jgi:hypothetical protein
MVPPPCTPQHRLAVGIPPENIKKAHSNAKRQPRPLPLRRQLFVDDQEVGQEEV